MANKHQQSSGNTNGTTMSYHYISTKMVTMKEDHNTSVGKDVEEHSFIAAGDVN